MRLSWSLSLFWHLALFNGVSLRSCSCDKLWVVQGFPPRFNTRLDCFLEELLDLIALIILCVGAGIPIAVVGLSNFRELLISDAIVSSNIRFGLHKVDVRSFLVQALCSHLPHLLRNFLKLFGLIGRYAIDEQVGFLVEDAHRDRFNDIDLLECDDDADFEIVAEVDSHVLFEAEPDRGLSLELFCKVALDQRIFAGTTMSAYIDSHANQVQWRLDDLSLPSYCCLVAEMIERSETIELFLRQEGL